MSDRLASDDLRDDRSSEGSFDFLTPPSQAVDRAIGASPSPGPHSGAGERDLREPGGRLSARLSRDGASSDSPLKEPRSPAGRRRPRDVNADRIALLRAAITADPDEFIAARLTPAIELLMIANRLDGAQTQSGER